MKTATGVSAFAQVALVVIAAVILHASTTRAQPPGAGAYTSTDNGGYVHVGRYSSSWTSANGRLQLDNGLNYASWDGTALGTQWNFQCGYLVDAVLLSEHMDAWGNGLRQYMLVYVGGIGMLSGDGPWGGGDPSYTVVLDYSVVTTAFSYLNHIVTSAVSNSQFSGSLFGYPTSCLAMFEGNDYEFDTGTSLPIGYPPFLDPHACTEARTLGSWGNVGDITITIQCSLASEEITWGQVKARYR